MMTKAEILALLATDTPASRSLVRGLLGQPNHANDPDILAAARSLAEQLLGVASPPAPAGDADARI